ncbi:MAG: FHA domain-containing protein [Nitrospirae bacterium]|nr:FHA domain-containing protein [Nitrospirota bacterium]
MIFVFIVLVGLVIVRSGLGIELRRVKELYEKQYEFVDKQVVVQGSVEKIVDIATTEKVGNFFLKDDAGDVILVKAREMPMSPGANIRVEGTMLIATNSQGQKGGIFIHAFKITTQAQQQPETALKPQATGQLESTSRGLKTSAKGILVTVVVVTLLMVAAIILIRIRATGKAQVVLEDPTFSTKDTLTNKINVSKNNAIIRAPSNTTQQLINGYLEITGGLQGTLGKKIFIVSPYTKIGREEEGVDKSSGWITFPPECVTVSRYQADLRYEQGQYVIISRSRVNPTLVNHMPLMKDYAVVVNHNDKIKLGEVELTFRSK